MNIGIDIDDTIAKTHETALPYAKDFIKNTLNKNVEIDYSKVIDHNYIRDAFGITDEEAERFWKEKYYVVLENIKPIEDSISIIKKLKEDGNNIIFITARWDEKEGSAYKVSKNWLEKYEIPYDKIIVGIDKKAPIALEEKIDVFIDDSIRNCVEVENVGIKSYLMTSSINKNNSSRNVERVYSWKEVYKKINDYEEDKTSGIV